MVKKELVNDRGIMQLAETLLVSACETNRYRDQEIMQEVDGEKAHAKDVLSWTEKLGYPASTALKVAALFHDIDRVVNLGVGGGFKGDRTSQAYLDHKKAHAKRSAEYISQKLSENSLNKVLITRVSFLISHHDDTGEEVRRLNDPDLNILVAADSFSFFTTVAPKLYAAEGDERLRDKIRFMIEKMPAFAVKLLASQKLENPIFERLKNEVIEELKAA